MAGGGEVKLPKSVRFPQHAPSAPLCTHAAGFPLFWRLSISGVFAAFGYGDGRTPSHVSVCVNDSLLCAGTFGPRASLPQSFPFKKMCPSTRLQQELDRILHAHAHALWHETCVWHVL